MEDTPAECTEAIVIDSGRWRGDRRWGEVAIAAALPWPLLPALPGGGGQLAVVKVFALLTCHRLERDIDRRRFSRVDIRLEIAPVLVLVFDPGGDLVRRGGRGWHLVRGRDIGLPDRASPVTDRQGRSCVANGNVCANGNGSSSSGSSSSSSGSSNSTRRQVSQSTEIQPRQRLRGAITCGEWGWGRGSQGGGVCSLTVRCRRL